MSIAVKTILELAVVLLLIYGYIHEQDVINFEQRLKAKILKFLLGVKENDKRRS